MPNLRRQSRSLSEDCAVVIVRLFEATRERVGAEPGCDGKRPDIVSNALMLCGDEVSQT